MPYTAVQKRGGRCAPLNFQRSVQLDLTSTQAWLRCEQACLPYRRCSSTRIEEGERVHLLRTDGVAGDIHQLGRLRTVSQRRDNNENIPMHALACSRCGYSPFMCTGTSISCFT